MDRLVAALARPGVDGVLATPDILEDLLLLGALEGKLVIGSMNRGGLQGASFELDDRFTAFDAATITAHGLEGGKMLIRIDLADPGSAATLEASGRAVTALAAAGKLAMVEPFLTTRRARITPDQVGLPTAGTRRVPGLRRSASAAGRIRILK